MCAGRRLIIPHIGGAESWAGVGGDDPCFCQRGIGAGRRKGADPAREKDRLVLCPSREAYVEALLDRVGHALKERSITLKELLDDGEEIREEVF